MALGLAPNSTGHPPRHRYQVATAKTGPSHFASLAEKDCSVLEGIPLTAVSRTLLDLAAVFNPTRLERVIERSEELGLLDLHAIDALPAPAMNFSVGEYELDAYWQRERFAVELDVYPTHGSRAAFEHDRLRQENLKLRGIEMIRVTGTRLDREPRAVIERVGTLLQQRRHQLGLAEA